jgi:Protein of unknown function (DUF1592)/Protein of unknown function (DUF1588)/Protein of unknown function (DUF1595)/Protein of unknown function (DUF1585)
MRHLSFAALACLCLIGCEGRIAGGLGAGSVPLNPDGTPVIEPSVDSESQLPAFQPGEVRARVLIQIQYRNSIRNLLGNAAASAVTPPADVVVNGLTVIGASQLAVSSSSVSRYEANAFLAAQAALADRGPSIIACTPAGVGDRACMAQVVNALGSKAFRRTLSDQESTALIDLGIEASTAYKSFSRGVEFAIAALIQSPSFLYLVETGVDDGQQLKIDGYSLASKLSYFLTNSPPDEILLNAAQNGTLDTEAGLRAQAERLSATPEAEEAAQAFFDEYFELAAAGGISKDSTIFGFFDSALAADMQAETQKTLRAILFGPQADLRDIFTSRKTFLSTRLAKHYGLLQPSPGFQAVTLPDSQPRMGIFTQGAFLALRSHPAENSPTLRGKFVREQLMCQQVPSPPANVDTSLPKPVDNIPRTLRQRLDIHLSKPSCAGCHKFMDPIGFAFENFDATGRYRIKEGDLSVDASGTLDELGGFVDAAGLMEKLRSDPKVLNCLTRAAFREALGRVDLPEEARPIFRAQKKLEAQGYRYQQLLVEVAASDAFRFGRKAP